MKLLQVIETGGGGSGRHFLDLVAGLAERGHDLTTVYSPVRAEPAFVSDLHDIGGIAVHAVPMRRAVTLQDAADYLALRRLVVRLGRFEIAHGHSSKAGALVRMLPRRLAKARVYTPHALRTMDPTLGRAGRMVYGGIEAALARRTDALIAVSPEEAAHAASLGGPPPRVIVNGVAPRAFLPQATARAHLGLSPDALVVGLVGRLSRQKDPELFVAAIRRAAERLPALVGVLIGDGELRADLERAASGAPVVFAGWQNDAAALLPAFDLFAMTSRYEAMPYVLIEALHAGLPILTTRVGGAEATVLPGRNGTIVPVGVTAEALADALVQLLSDVGSLTAMAHASHELAARFTRDAMVDQTEAVYRSILPN